MLWYHFLNQTARLALALCWPSNLFVTGVLFPEPAVQFFGRLQLSLCEVRFYQSIRALAYWSITFVFTQYMCSVPCCYPLAVTILCYRKFESTFSSFWGLYFSPKSIVLIALIYGPNDFFASLVKIVKF